MSDVRLPHGVQVIWQLQLPPIGPRHCYFEVPDQQTFDRLQGALRDNGLPPARLLPQYEQREGDRVVALGACVCHDDPSRHPVLDLLDFLPTGFEKRIARCAAERSLPVAFMPVSTLAYHFGIPSDMRLLYADLYHWDPWQHEWRLQQVNEILLRYGLPSRKQLTFKDGRRVLCILGIWKEPGREGTWVRYAVAAADRRRAYTVDLHYKQSHDVLICLAVGDKIAVTVQADELREWETWRLPNWSVHRKPTNAVLHEAIAPWLPTARLSVSSLGDRKTGGRRQVFKLLRLDAPLGEVQEKQPDWDRNIVWKSWDEISSALSQGFLDPDAELVVTRLLRRFPKQADLFETA